MRNHTARSPARRYHPLLILRGEVKPFHLNQRNAIYRTGQHKYMFEGLPIPKSFSLHSSLVWDFRWLRENSYRRRSITS